VQHQQLMQSCVLYEEDHANGQWVVQSQPQEDVNYMGNQKLPRKLQNFQSRMEVSS